MKKLYLFNSVVEIKINIHWSESNSWIYVYTVLNKNLTKFCWSRAGGSVLILRTANCLARFLKFGTDIKKLANEQKIEDNYEASESTYLILWNVEL
jgi:hypothetical protein